VEYRELVYRDAGELEAAVEHVNPADGVVMSYNETFYCHSAVATVLRQCLRRKLPLIWNNNNHVAALGALAGIGADHETAGRTAGETAAAILKGTPPGELPPIQVEDQVAWLNLVTAERLGLQPPQPVLDYFDRCITRQDDEHGI
jgi:ABC-type uncharacterized transport system substrate-binding protein